ncbi:hypothetical protein VTK26DRAFT_744 [Humicola hyalothermophila]
MWPENLDLVVPGLSRVSVSKRDFGGSLRARGYPRYERLAVYLQIIRRHENRCPRLDQPNFAKGQGVISRVAGEIINGVSHVSIGANCGVSLPKAWSVSHPNQSIHQKNLQRLGPSLTVLQTMFGTG